MAPETILHYKWIALSNTTIGILMATHQWLDSFDRPDRIIFAASYSIRSRPATRLNFLWILMGFLLVTSVSS